MASFIEGRPYMDTTHDLPFICDKKTISWERLESLRLRKLGLENRYSRHFNVTRQSNTMQRERTSDLMGSCNPSQMDTPRFTPRGTKVNIFI